MKNTSKKSEDKTAKVTKKKSKEELLKSISHASQKKEIDPVREDKEKPQTKESKDSFFPRFGMSEERGNSIQSKVTELMIEGFNKDREGSDEYDIPSTLKKIDSLFGLPNEKIIAFYVAGQVVQSLNTPQGQLEATIIGRLGGFLSEDQE